MFRFLIIDLLRGTRIVLHYYKYRHLYKKSSNELISCQKERLLKLVRFLVRNQKSIFVSSDAVLNFSSDDNLDKLLVTDKNFYTDNYCRVFDKSKGPHEKNYTGGSTGVPFKYILDKETISRTRAFNYYLWNRYINYGLGDRVLVVGGSSLGANNGFIKKAYNFLQNKFFIPGDILKLEDVEPYLDMILLGRYDVLYGYPSAILSYVNLAKQKGLKFDKRIKGIVTTSEMLYEKDKLLIEDYFSTTVLNIYGANDGGIISGSIDNENFIYNGLDCFVENYSKQDDEECELLLTNINSRVFPFIRYRVGDIGNIVKDSPLGPFVITNLKGRTRDFFMNRKGDSFHGSLINKLVKDLPNIGEYQLVQNKNYDITLKVRLLGEEHAELYSSILKSRFEDLLSDDSIEFSVVYVDNFELNANNKKKLIISDVN